MKVEENLHLLSEEENDSGIVVEDASVEKSVIESDTSGMFFVQNISSLSSNQEDNYISIMPAPSKSNYNEYPLMISTAARFGIDKRSLCEKGNGLLTDLGILIFSFKGHYWILLLNKILLGIINDQNRLRPTKILRQFRKYGVRLSNYTVDAGGLLCLMFDGRKDFTLSRLGRHVVKEEHIVILEEPGSIYKDNITPKSGKAVDIADDLMTFIKKTSSKKTLRVIGADGTAVNTGCENGVITLLERKLRRPLQWVICMLHLNELPLRHLFKLMDGSTSGPSSFKGPIGCVIVNDLRSLPIEKFRRIQGRVPKLNQEVISKFTGDQRYFYEMARAI